VRIATRPTSNRGETCRHVGIGTSIAFTLMVSKSCGHIRSGSSRCSLFAVTTQAKAGKVTPEFTT